jgi:hypothetical protein
MIGIPANNKSSPDEIWEENFRVIKNTLNENYGKIIKDDLFNYYTEEIGITELINFLKVKDDVEKFSGFRFTNTGNVFIELKEIPYISKNFDEEADVFINKKEEKYNYDIIKASLLSYFIQELVEDIPTNSILRDEKDVNDFIKVFEVKFLYEYVIPTLKALNKNIKKIN